VPGNLGAQPIPTRHRGAIFSRSSGETVHRFARGLEHEQLLRECLPRDRAAARAGRRGPRSRCGAVRATIFPSDDGPPRSRRRPRLLPNPRAESDNREILACFSAVSEPSRPTTFRPTPRRMTYARRLPPKPERAGRGRTPRTGPLLERRAGVETACLRARRSVGRCRASEGRSPCSSAPRNLQEPSRRRPPVMRCPRFDLSDPMGRPRGGEH